MHPAGWDEAKLLAECDVRRQRRSGPGGQHRNKVETAITITHRATGVQGQASERRSQEENRRRALFRLRLSLAVDVRHPVTLEIYQPSALWMSRLRGERVLVNSEHDDFPALLAEALDLLAACDLEPKTASAHLRCTSSQLIKLIQLEPRAIAELNRQRQVAGKSALR